MRSQFVIQANSEIRAELKDKGIPLWKLGVELDVSEGTIVRWLRTDLTETEKTRIEGAIKRLMEVKENEQV